MTNDNEGVWRPQSTFWIDAAMVSVAVVPAFTVPFLASWLLNGTLAIAAVVMCALLMAVYVLLAGEAIEDWWDDFKLEHRVQNIGLPLSVAIPVLGAVVGRMV